MELNGREIKFAYNMRAAKMFADFCPERDFSRIGEALTGKYGNIIDNQATFIIALNLGYCRSAEHKDEGLAPITMDEILDLDQGTFQDLFMEAANTMAEQQKTNMEAKPAPRKKANAQLVDQS